MVIELFPMYPNSVKLKCLEVLDIARNGLFNGKL